MKYDKNRQPRIVGQSRHFLPPSCLHKKTESAMKKGWLRPGWLFIPALLLGASYAHAVTSQGNFPPCRPATRSGRIAG